jgi:F-type H+-transporting ATPase subunit a
VNHSPLQASILFHVGLVPIARPVLTTWGLIAMLTLACGLATRSLKVIPGGCQAVIESLVLAVEDQIQSIVGRDAAPFSPLLGTLFVFLVFANLSGILPGVKAPTASLETPAALALIVFLSAHFFGIRFQGPLPYLKGYLKPNPALLPLNILSEITRSFSLAIRLFGNIMSDELVLAIILALAGLLVPVPFMAFAILVGLVQAYIFSILATVYVAGAIGAISSEGGG